MEMLIKYCFLNFCIKTALGKIRKKTLIIRTKSERQWTDPSPLSDNSFLINIIETVRHYHSIAKLD